MDKLYAGLKDLANERRAKLDDALKLFRLNREVLSVFIYIYLSFYLSFVYISYYFNIFSIHSRGVQRNSKGGEANIETNTLFCEILIKILIRLITL